ncbi:MAG: EpsG family protein [Treponema sp.]|nr:EpsG family protein [Treponema sp.]
MTMTFVFLGGIRWRTGTDWNNYSTFFLSNRSLKSFFQYLFEPGYTLLNYGVKQLSDSYTVFLFIFHFLIIVPKMIFIRKTAYYPLVSVLLYWCIYFCEIVAVRNALAVSILLMSLFSIQNKNKKEFVILTLLATSIHYSCAMWFFAYRIYYFDFTIKKWKKLIFVSLILAVTGRYIYPPIVKLVFSPISGNIAWKIVYYATTYKESATSAFTKMLSIGKRVIFIPFIFMFYKKLWFLSPYNKGIINLYLFGNVFYLSFFSGFTQMNRCVIANLFLEVILLPEFILCFRKKATKMIFLFLLLLYGVFKMLTAIRPFTDVLVPYYTIFNYQSRVMY